MADYNIPTLKEEIDRERRREGDRGRMEEAAAERIVELQGVGHHCIDPGRVMRGQSERAAPDPTFGPAADFPAELAQFRNNHPPSASPDGHLIKNRLNYG